MRYRVLLVVALLVLSGCQFLASDPTDGEASDSTPNGVTSEAIQTTEGLPSRQKYRIRPGRSMSSA